MSRLTFDGLLAILYLLHAPFCEGFFLEPFLFQEIPNLDRTTHFENSLLPELNQVLPRIKTYSPGEQKKEGQPLGDVPCESQSLGNETSLTVSFENPTHRTPSSKAYSQSFRSSKLSDLLRLSSIIDNLRNGISLPTMTEEFTGAENGLNGEPNGEDISISFLENQRTITTTTTTKPPTTTGAGVITITNDRENCVNKNDCNIFNIQGLLWKLFHAQTTQQPTTPQPTTPQPTTPQPTTTQLHQVDENEVFPFVNFENLFYDTVPRTAAPAVKETTEVVSSNNILGDVVNGETNSEPNLFNLQNFISKILNINPDRRPQRSTEAPRTTTVNIQQSRVQNVPSQIFQDLFPALDFQKFLPAIAEVFPPVQENQKQPGQNERVSYTYATQIENPTPVVSLEQKKRSGGQKEDESKPSLLGKISAAISMQPMIDFFTIK